MTTSLNTPMSRDEVLKTFAPLLHALGQGPAPVATKAEAAEQARAREIVERAASYTVESIIKELADLQVGLGGAVDGLAERMQSEAVKLVELRRAIASETKHLSDLRSTRVAAEALEILIQDHKKKIQTLDDKTTAERQDLDDKIGKQREAWARDQSDRAAALADADAALTRDRKAKEEQYTYEIDRQRKLVADEFAEKRRLQERTIGEAGAQKDKNWGEREKVLTAARSEIEALRSKVEVFPKELDEAAKKSRERTISKVAADSKFEAELLEKEVAANIEVYELRLKSLDERIVRQASQLIDLQKQLTTALDQTQNLAHKAIEGTSGKK